MHVRIDQLLSLRDGGPVEASVRNHVQQCAACLAELSRLEATRDRLRSLPAMESPRDVWSDIQTRVAQPPRRIGAGVGVGIAAAVGALAIVTLSVVNQRDADPPTPLATVEPIASDDLDTLIEQSRELEALLAFLPQRPQVERVSMATTVDSIEQRIQWLDWQLANGPDAGLDRQQAQRLWSERVDLMDSLVKVRYAETAPLMF